MWPFKKANNYFPPPEWFRDNAPRGFTPDIWDLELAPYQPLFIYNHMMEKHRSHILLKDHSILVATAFTKRNNWVLWKKKLGKGTYPIPLRVPFDQIPTGRIRGELYLVESNHFLELDEYMSNGVEFRRKKTEVIVPYRHTKRIVNEDHNYETTCQDLVFMTHAYMYMGRYTYWEDFLDGGYDFGRCTLYEPKGKLLTEKYYAFTPLELNE